MLCALCRVLRLQEDNPDWMAMVQKKFPKKETKLLVGCSNGERQNPLTARPATCCCQGGRPPLLPSGGARRPGSAAACRRFSVRLFTWH